MSNQNMTQHQSAKRRQEIPNRVEPEVMPKVGSVGQLTNKLLWFKESVIGKVAEKSYSAVFLEPMKNPKYYETIKNPLDIGTIAKRIDNRYYQNMGEAVRDFRIMLDNCLKFYAHDDPVHENGIQLAEFFMEIMENQPRGPEIRCTRYPRKATLKTEYRKLTKGPKEPETWQSQCRAKLSGMRTRANQLDMPVARALVLEKCDTLNTKLTKGEFATHEQFIAEFNRTFHDFRESTVKHLQTNCDSSPTKKPRLEEPMDIPLKGLPSRKFYWVSSESDSSSECSCSSSSSCSCKEDSICDSSSSSSCSCKEDSNCDSSSSCSCNEDSNCDTQPSTDSSSHSDPSDFSFHCSSYELLSDSSE